MMPMYVAALRSVKNVHLNSSHKKKKINRDENQLVHISSITPQQLDIYGKAQNCENEKQIGHVHAQLTSLTENNEIFYRYACNLLHIKFVPSLCLFF